MCWKKVLQEEMEKPYMIELKKRLEADYLEKRIFPPQELVFNALGLTPLESVKVVILGQDPYHNPGEAMGLSFSVPDGVKIPPSLRNIYHELNTDLGIAIPNHGDLTSWAKQGVLLLNTTLTVEQNRPMSHKDYGWTLFTNRIISEINKRDQPCVFVLWGGHARSKKILIDQEKHLVIESAHPSPLSAHNGFFHSRPFSRINAFLREKGIKEIDWQL